MEGSRMTDTMTAEEYLALKKTPPPRKNKYNAKKHAFNGRLFGSKAEAYRAMALQIELVSGNVISYVCQPPALMLGTPHNKYRPDFLVIPKDGTPWYEDVKGRETPKFKKDRKLWKDYGLLDLHIITGSWNNLRRSEIIKPKRVILAPFEPTAPIPSEEWDR